MFELGFGETEREVAVDRLPVRGQVPGWLRGTLIRNGPGTFHVGAERYRHWFDGLAMLHRFFFDDGQVSYRNRFLDCQAYREARETGTICYSEFATDPQRSLLGRVGTIFSPKITDSAKVSVAHLASRHLALAETPIQVEFDPDTLATRGSFCYEDRLMGQMTTVHPQFDDENGRAYNLVTRYHRISHYNLHAIEANGSVRLVASLPVQKPAYMHSFGMSPTYLILTEFPLVVNSVHLLLWLRPYIENFRWEPQRGTPFWVVNRHTGELVGRFECDPFFAFHHVNAFEQGDELVVDLVAYEDADVLSAYYLDRLEQDQHEIPWGTLRRYRVPLQGGRVRSEVLSDACMELPRFDYGRYNMQEAYRFVYASSQRPEHPTGFYNQLVKADIQSGRSWTWFEAGCYPGEPVFVGRPGRRAEDEGVILSVVLDADHAASFLLVLDAGSFSERARVEIPHPVLFGYHGEFFGGT
ncbi:MAG: carotenoid oxygenase family protein [Anaerolineae bacterium]|jgi:carotenoid cleavage dioxygenase-like enzyme